METWEDQVLNEIRRWLKNGMTIRATDPDGRILEKLLDGTCYAGLTIKGNGNQIAYLSDDML